MTQSEEGRSYKYTTTVPCVYDILNLGDAGRWYSDGRIVLNRPSISNNVDRIKFRSFSSDIRSDIENLSSPSITAKLCGNFTFYNSPTSTFNPPSSCTSDVVEGTEVGIIPRISDLTVQIYNQSGFQQYQAANGIYQNGVNNEMTFSEFNIPLVTSFQDSIDDMLNYAKYNFNKLLGLFDNTAINKNIYDTSTFVYGNVNLTPYVSELGGNAWVNAPVWFLRTDSAGSMTYGATWKTGTEDPSLVAGGVSYPNNKLIGPVFNDISATYANPFCIFRRFASLRNSDNIDVTYGVVNMQGEAGTGVTISKPYCENVSNSLSHPFDTHPIRSSTLTFYKSNFNILGSTNQNSTNWNLSLVEMSMSDVSNVLQYRDALDFYYFNATNTTPKYYIIINDSAIPYYSLASNNDDNETISSMADDSYVFLASYFFRSSTKNHLLLLFTNYAYIKILHFILDSLGGGILPAVHSIKNIELPTDPTSQYKQQKQFAFYANDWTLENYLEYMQELQHVTVPNAPLFILPKFTDGTNGAILFDLDETEEIYPQTIWSTDSTVQENIFYMNNTLYTIWRQNGTTKISGCGPCCAINDPADAILNVDDARAFNLYFYHSWYKTLKSTQEYWLDITTYVNDYNLAFPIVNALDTHTYANESIAIGNETPELANNDITWLIDATGAQVYIKDQTFENIYSFAQSALTVNFNLYPNQGNLENPVFVQLYPSNPTIGEPSTISDTTYSWINNKHITQIAANPYFYAADSTLSFNNNAFKIQDDGSITFPCIPLVSVDGAYNGLLTFFVKFETSPAILTFDPNIKQSERFANRYNYCKQFLNKTPSLYNDTYPFNSYIYYNNPTLYEKINVYLQLQNTDRTLTLIISGFQTIDSILFKSNEQSFIDYKEMITSPYINVIECRLLDSNGETLTPELAKNIYSNITISADWSYFSS